MGRFTARSETVVARDEFARFAQRCNAATKDAVEDIVKDGAKEARRQAPVGAKPDKRPGHTRLKKSIRTRVRGYEGHWYSISKHAMPIEKGARPHPITGKLVFNWKRGIFWWNNPEYDNWNETEGATVRHPGNAPNNFLERSFNIVARGGGSIRRIRAAYRRHGLS